MARWATSGRTWHRWPDGRKMEWTADQAEMQVADLAEFRQRWLEIDWRQKRVVETIRFVILVSKGWRDGRQ